VTATMPLVKTVTLPAGFRDVTDYWFSAPREGRQVIVRCEPDISGMDALLNIADEYADQTTEMFQASVSARSVNLLAKPPRVELTFNYSADTNDNPGPTVERTAFLLAPDGIGVQISLMSGAGDSQAAAEYKRVLESIQPAELPKGASGRTFLTLPTKGDIRQVGPVVFKLSHEYLNPSLFRVMDTDGETELSVGFLNSVPLSVDDTEKPSIFRQLGTAVGIDGKPVCFVIDELPESPILAEFSSASDTRKTGFVPTETEEIELNDGSRAVITVRTANRSKEVKDLIANLRVHLVDKGKDKTALGLKPKSDIPWQNIEAKYPIASRHTGEVVNIMTYGAFVKLEPGIEGLVHISEMSWTKRINHPNELVRIGDKIEVQVLNINRDKQEISLGMKQCQDNPWDKVADRYPPNTVVSGVVRNLTNYGAFIEIEEGIDGLLHVSDMSWVRKVSHPSEVVQKGQKVTCIVLNVDQERKRVALGLKQMASDPWEGGIPGRYKPGEVKKGKVTKLASFGMFVELEPGLEGLLPISELSDDKVENPEDLVKVGDDIEVKVLRVDSKDRKIGLSRKDRHDVPLEKAVPESTDAKGMAIEPRGHGEAG
jgi:predicted RNA-binding protein with RPS1 domain